MSGQLQAFIAFCVFIALLLLLVRWLLHRGREGMERQARMDVEELKKQPP